MGLEDKNKRKIKRIPYGKSDFEAINKEDRYYVDKTHYIPLLELTDYQFLIRLRSITIYVKIIILIIVMIILIVYNFSPKSKFSF